MDPSKCYLEMFDAMQVGDFATARDRALALRDWLEDGGFYPPNYSPSEVRDYLCQVLRSTEDVSASSEEDDT